MHYKKFFTEIFFENSERIRATKEQELQNKSNIIIFM